MSIIIRTFIMLSATKLKQNDKKMTTSIKTTRSNVFTNAWKLVKQAGYTLSNALKEAWSKIKKAMENNWVSQEVIGRVINAKKFNGIVYGQRSGNWTLFGIYLDGQYVYICRDKANAPRTKKEIEAELSIGGLKTEKINENTANVVTTAKSGKSEWLINGDRIIRNNLSYGEMWEKYGTDFE